MRSCCYEIDGRRVRLGAFPVSIETKAYMRLARNAGRSAMIALVRESLNGNRLVLGVDRLDYSKGIPDRIKGFERFLELNPQWHGKVTFLQLTPKSRSGIKQYGDIESEVTGLIGKVNGQFGDAAWTPIRYVNRSYSRTVLAGMYRAADVGLVTPLRDGMNLVAKEYLAAQDPENPGVLMLSQFAGAAQELDRALIVNPHETDALAAALKRALEMPLEERRERHAPMLAHLMQDDIKKWAKSYLSTLAGGLPRHSLLGGIRSLLSAGSDPTQLAFRRAANAHLANGADAEKRSIPAAVSLRTPDVRELSSPFLPRR